MIVKNNKTDARQEFGIMDQEETDVNSENFVIPDLHIANNNLVRIIALLPDNCRRAFYWAVVEGLPVGEIALRQGCSILSVHNDLSYALRYIRRNVTSYRLIISACDGTDPCPASKPTAKSQPPKANS